MEAIKWQENEQLNIEVEDGKIIIEKAQKTERKNIKELFADFDGQYVPTEINWESHGVKRCCKTRWHYQA